MFVGMAAELEDKVRLVKIPSLSFLKNLRGLSLPITRIRSPYMHIMQRMAPVCVSVTLSIERSESPPRLITRSDIETKAASGINLVIRVVMVKNSVLRASKSSFNIEEYFPTIPTEIPQSIARKIS